MSLDPIDYDVVELRELARRRGDRYLEDGFLWPEPSEGFPAVDDLAEVDRDVSWTGSHEERQKPYLSSLPDTDAGESLAQGWVRRLVESAGFRGATEALAYYEALGWITERVEDALHDHMLAAGNVPGGSLSDLDREAHVESLARVIALAQVESESPDDESAEGESSGRESSGRESPDRDSSGARPPDTGGAGDETEPRHADGDPDGV